MSDSEQSRKVDLEIMLGPEFINNEDEQPKVESPVMESEAVEVPIDAKKEKFEVEEDLEVSNAEKVEDADESLDIEARAMALGWKPQDEFSDESKDFLTAEEFVAREPDVVQIRKLKKHIKSLEKRSEEQSRVLENLDEHFKKAEAKGRMAAIKELEEKRLQAIEEDDMEAFASYDDALMNARKEDMEASKAAEVRQSAEAEHEQPTEEVIQFKKRNPWFQGSSPEHYKMTQDAIDYLNYLDTVSPDMPQAEAVSKLEKFIHMQYPDKFENPKRKSAPAVGRSSPNRAAPGGPSYQDLNAMQKSLFDTLKAQIPDLTVEQYLANRSSNKTIDL